MRLYGLLLSTMMLGACAPQSHFASSQGSQTRLNFSIKQKGLGQWSKSLNGVGGGAFEASDDFCYAIHVTGDSPELRRVNPPTRNTCDNAPAGLGLFKGLFKKGDSVDLEIPVGVKRRFDLIGYSKSLFTGGSCEGTFKVNPAAPGSSKISVAYWNGEKLDAKAQLIASATTDITVGDNAIELVATGDSAIGVPYGCDELPRVVVKDLTSGGLASFRYIKNFPLGGTCTEAGFDVTLKVGALSATTPCAADHTWGTTLDLSSVADGNIELVVTQRDFVGNLSLPAKLPLVKNSAAQVKFSSDFLNSAAGGFPLQSAPIVLTAEDASGIIPVSGVIQLKAYSDSSCTTDISTDLRLGGSAVTSVAVTSGSATISDVNYLNSGGSNQTLYLQAEVPSQFKSSCKGPIVVSPNQGVLSIVNSSVIPTTPVVAGTSLTGVTVRYQTYFGTPLTSGSSQTIAFYAYNAAACPSGQGASLAQTTLSPGQSSVIFSSIALNDITRMSLNVSFYGGGSPNAQAVCYPLTVTPSGSTRLLKIASLPTTGAVGSPFGFNVMYTDGYYNPVNAPAGVTVNVFQSIGSSGCVSSTDQIGTAVISSGQNNVSLSGISTNVAGAYYLRASTLTAGVTETNCLDVIQINPGSAHHFNFALPGSAITAGSGFGVNVKVQDVYGNDLTNLNGNTISLAGYSDSGCSVGLSSTLNGTNPITIAGNQASFSLSYNHPASIYLKATLSAGGTPGTLCAGPVQIIAGAATQLAIQMPGQSFTEGSPVSGTISGIATGVPFNVTVRALDSQYNIASGTSGTLKITTQDPNDDSELLSVGLLNGVTTFPLRMASASVNGLVNSLTVKAPSSGLQATVSSYPVSDVCAMSESASPFHAGSGTVASPYVICTDTQLGALATGSTYWDKHFILGQNIDLSVNYSTGSGWLPIANSGTPFTGTFDGVGHGIYGLMINRTGTNYVGLFAALGGGSEVKRLKIFALTQIAGLAEVGALAGYSEGSIDSVAVDLNGGVISSAGDDLGGLVGWQYGGQISNSTVTGSGGAVKFGGTQAAGGLVGFLNGGAKIEKSIVSSMVVCSEYPSTCGATRSYMGGLVGIASGGATEIEFSGSSGLVQGQSILGGLVGQLDQGTVKDSYSQSTVQPGGTYASGASYAGGLIGYITNLSSVVNRTYSTGTVYVGSSYLKLGLVVGLSPASWDCGAGSCVAQTASGVTNHTGAIGVLGSAIAGSTLSNAVSLGTTAMKISTNYSWDFSLNSTLNFTTGNPQWMIANTLDYPHFQWERMAAWDNTWGGSAVISDGGLRAVQTAGGTSTVRSKRALPNTGIWYWEVQVNPSSASHVGVGVVQSGSSNALGLGYGASSALSGFGFFDSGTVYHNNTTAAAPGNAYGSAYAVGDVIGVMLNNGILYYYKNGVSLGAASFGTSLFSTEYPAAGSSQAGQSYDLTLNPGVRSFVVDTSTLPSGWKPLNYYQ